MSMRVTVTGTEQLITQLRRRGLNVQMALEQILLAAAEPIGQAAADNARGISQRTADAITKETIARRSGRVEVHVGPDRKKAWYAHIIEFGAGAHTIRPRKAKALRFTNGALRRYARHPGSPARPFMRPAFDNRREQAKAVAAAEIRKRLR